MYDLRPDVYWHLTHRGDILLHNVRLRKGWGYSVSAFAKGELENAVRPYSLVNANSERERLWEEVRAAHFTDCPSRIKALFASVSKEDAEWAMREWFTEQDRIVVEMKAAVGAKVHVADTRLLDCAEPQWREAAIRYWNGDRTDDPRLEVVIDGWVYFPNWEREPFGTYKALF